MFLIEETDLDKLVQGQMNRDQGQLRYCTRLCDEYECLIVIYELLMTYRTRST